MIDTSIENYSLDKHQVRIDYTTVSPRFSATDPASLNNGIEYMNEHGYAVFSDVMSPDDIAANKELLWEFLETIPGRNIRRDDKTTWSNHW